MLQNVSAQSSNIDAANDLTRRVRAVRLPRALARNAVRSGLLDRTAKVGPKDALAKKLQTASSQVEALRMKIVATKEGGMITGEERLREHMANLYGELTGYEGRPTQTQTERADALTRELADVVRDFDAWVKNELPAINAALAKKKLESIVVP